MLVESAHYTIFEGFVGTLRTNIIVCGLSVIGYNYRFVLSLLLFLLFLFDGMLDLYTKVV